VKALYFQFADRAISSEVIKEELREIVWDKDSRYSHIFINVNRENWYLQTFFKVPENINAAVDFQSNTNDRFIKLEIALQSLYLSVAADETLCISTLMGLGYHKDTSH
jgi:hypothetical protein